MTKILVADDNSNIQRTVTQALAHLDTEVVAVNNGQAAVRKVAEISPDLVLADIFMPVRNGYEVCEYVKKNPATAHVPVILLAGAFDPLDEREAQRVGADGILKKPFVPPDPLVNMVQTLLDRLATLRAHHDPAPEVAAQPPAASQGPGPAPAEAAFHEEPAELPMAETAKKTSVAFAEADQPVAFSSLLDAPAALPAETSSPLDFHGQPHGELPSDSHQAQKADSANFWQDEAAPLPELPLAHLDTPRGASHAPETGQPGHHESTPEAHAKAEPAHTETLPEDDSANLLQPIQPHEIVREEMDVPATTVVDEDPIVLDPSKYASLTVNAGPAPELAKNPLEWMASAPVRELAQHTTAELPAVEATMPDPPAELSAQAEAGGPEPASSYPMPSEIDAAAESEPTKSITDSFSMHEASSLSADQSAEHSVARPSGVEHEEIAPGADDFASLAPVSEAAEPSSAPSPSAPPAHPLDEEDAEPPVAPSVALLQHDFPMPAHEHALGLEESASSSTGLADAHDQRVHSFSRIEAPANPAPNPAHVEEVEPEDAEPMDVKLGERVADFAESYVADEVKRSSEPAHLEIPAPASKSSPPAAVDLSSDPDPALVDAVVQRVLEKMKPEVVDIITKEFLRPVVQAMVNREIEKH